MIRPVDAKSNGNKKKRNSRKEKRSKQQKPSSKNATRPSDVYEAEEKDPEEELKAGQRYDVCCISYRRKLFASWPEAATMTVSFCAAS